jgi:hypothetical protein
MMLGSLLQMKLAVDQILPISILSNKISASLEDVSDRIFEDAAFNIANRDLRIKPEDAKLITKTLMSLDEFKNYKWTQLKSPTHIRLVKITASPKTVGELGSNGHPRAFEVIEASCLDRELTCEIIEEDISTSLKYDAISYTWLGFPQNIPLRVKGEQRLWINAPLYACLQRLMANSDNRLCWIDQICVDQTNMEEKNAQVLLMHKIYGKASKTYIWLGEEDLDSREALTTLDNLNPVGQNIPLGEQLTKAKLMLKGKLTDSKSETFRNRCSIGKLLNRAWFERAWIYQEASVSPSVMIIIGSSQIDFGRFISAVRAYCVAEQDQIRSFGQSLITTAKGYNTLVTIEDGRLKRSQKSTSDQLAAVLCRLGGTIQATDERDLVYALLAFQDPANPAIKPDYSMPIPGAYNAAAKSLIQRSGSLDLLGIAGIPKREGLASWAPDWTVRLPQGFPFYSAEVQTEFSACRGRKHALEKKASSPQSLFVTGRVIDRIAYVSSHDFNRDDRNKGGISRFLKLHEYVGTLCQLPPFALDAHDQTPENKTQTDKDNLLRRLLKVVVADRAYNSNALDLDTSPKHTHLTANELDDLLKAYDQDDSIRMENFRIPNFDHLTETRAVLREKMMICYRKRVFHGEKASLGLAPRDCAVGDVVVVLHGSKVPCVLRKEEEGSETSYRFVGQCYYEGAMYGDCCDWGEDAGEEFELR